MLPEDITSINKSLYNQLKRIFILGNFQIKTIKSLGLRLFSVPTTVAAEISIINNTVIWPINHPSTNKTSKGGIINDSRLLEGWLPSSMRTDTGAASGRTDAHLWRIPAAFFIRSSKGSCSFIAQRISWSSASICASRVSIVERSSFKMNRWWSGAWCGWQNIWVLSACTWSMADSQIPRVPIKMNRYQRWRAWREWYRS